MSQDQQGFCGHIAIVGVGSNNSEAARYARELLQDVPCSLVTKMPDKQTGELKIGLSDDLYNINFPLIHAHKQAQEALGFNVPSFAHADTQVASAALVGSKPQSSGTFLA